VLSVVDDVPVDSEAPMVTSSISGFNVLSVVDDVPVDSETPVVTLLISRCAGTVFRRCS
jgi:hypothetical protein